MRSEAPAYDHREYLALPPRTIFFCPYRKVRRRNTRLHAAIPEYVSELVFVLSGLRMHARYFSAQARLPVALHFFVRAAIPQCRVCRIRVSVTLVSAGHGQGLCAMLAYAWITDRGHLGSCYPVHTCTFRVCARIPATQDAERLSLSTIALVTRPPVQLLLHEGVRGDTFCDAEPPCLPSYISEWS